MNKLFPIVLAMLATPAIAEGTRELESHEHGVGELNIAIDGTTIAMEFYAPGADIVGFEHKAESAEDMAAIDAAIATLSRPLELFVMQAAAECTVVQASAELESEDHHDDHDDHEEKHGHDEGHEDGHDDEHAEEAGHTEFHAEYTLNCRKIDALSDITFAYFNTFENALEVEVKIVSPSGAKAFEVERDDPTLDLSGMI